MSGVPGPIRAALSAYRALLPFSFLNHYQVVFDEWEISTYSLRPCSSVSHIAVNVSGKFLCELFRSVCMIFQKYLRQDTQNYPYVLRVQQDGNWPATCTFPCWTTDRVQRYLLLFFKIRWDGIQTIKPSFNPPRATKSYTRIFSRSSNCVKPS